MNKQNLVIALAIAIAAIGIIASTEQFGSNQQVGKEPQTVPYVDVKSFLGAWYEQAVIPYYFERGCTKTTAHYSLNNDGTIKVNNTCIRDGKLHGGVGKAIPQDSTNAKLKVEFVETLDISGHYWVVRLAKDYSYTVTSSPNYQYLWILYREPVMPEPLYQSIVDDLKKDGFHTDKLVRTQQ